MMAGGVAALGLVGNALADVPVESMRPYFQKAAIQLDGRSRATLSRLGHPSAREVLVSEKMNKSQIGEYIYNVCGREGSRIDDKFKLTVVEYEIAAHYALPTLDFRPMCSEPQEAAKRASDLNALRQLPKTEQQEVVARAQIMLRLTKVLTLLHRGIADADAGRIR